MKELSNLLGVEEQEDDFGGHQFGSALNPVTATGGEEKKEIARPNAKIEVKRYDRSKEGGSASAAAKQTVAPPQPKEKDIWNETEVNLQAEEMPDDRKQPDFEVLFK